MTSGAYKTSLVSYFTHRDLFPSIMKVCLPVVQAFYHLDVEIDQTIACA
jgi:hypothetical protein